MPCTTLRSLLERMTRDQRAVIEYLLTELAVHRELNAGKRLLFTDAQRRKLARTAKKLSRKTLASIAPLVTPDTLLRWYRSRRPLRP
ncbi:MAG TPA: hypothetical protein VF331_03660 [Polyangiales bacterium]